MTGRVEEHPEVVTAGLLVGQPRTGREHLGLARSEIVDDEVEMRLLRVLGTGPHRRPISVDALTGDRHATARVELCPLVVDVGRVERPPGDRGVEAGERQMIRAVESDEAERGERHGLDARAARLATRRARAATPPFPTVTVPDHPIGRT